VQLDRIQLKGESRLDLGRLGVEEEGHLDSGVAAAAYGRGDPRPLTHDIEPSFGRQLFAPLWDQRHLVWFHLESHLDNLVLRGHFQVEPHPNRLAKESKVAVLDVPSVFSKMNGDPVGATELCKGRCPDGVWLVASPCLSERCNVVDVDSQARHGRRFLRQEIGESDLTTTAYRRFGPPR
jgi:hypothetical protein